MATQAAAMTGSLVDASSATALRLVSSAPRSPILLAVDGTSSAGGAVAVAVAVAREWHASLHVLSVADQLDDDAVRQVLECARTNEAALMVLGLAASDGVSSISSERVLRVMRRAAAPVLAVLSSQTQQPRHAIAAIDFGPASVSAARLALGIVQPGGTLYLAHVEPDFTSARADSAAIAASYRRGIDGAFTAFIRELDPPETVRIQPVVLDGAPLSALEQLADRVDADLIALGARCRNPSASQPLPRLTAAFLRARRVSVLSAPPRCGA